MLAIHTNQRARGGPWYTANRDHALALAMENIEKNNYKNLRANREKPRDRILILFMFTFVLQFFTVCVIFFVCFAMLSMFWICSAMFVWSNVHARRSACEATAQCLKYSLNI